MKNAYNYMSRFQKTKADLSSIDFVFDLNGPGPGLPDRVWDRAPAESGTDSGQPWVRTIKIKDKLRNRLAPVKAKSQTRIYT